MEIFDYLVEERNNNNITNELTIDIIKNKQDNEWTIWDWNYLDFKLNNYKCHPKIELPLAI